MQNGWEGRAGLVPLGGSQPPRYAAAQLLRGKEAARVRQARVKAVLVWQREGSAARHADPAACP